MYSGASNLVTATDNAFLLIIGISNLFSPRNKWSYYLLHG